VTIVAGVGYREPERPSVERPDRDLLGNLFLVAIFAEWVAMDRLGRLIGEGARGPEAGRLVVRQVRIKPRAGSLAFDFLWRCST
jgi:hypothetical protein